MALFDLSSNSLGFNLAVFGAAAGVVWFAGYKLERYSDAIAMKTGWGKAFLGLLLLAAATSLPEVATVTTASLTGNPHLAVHNLLGSVVMNLVILTIADALAGRKALTYQSPGFALLMQGVSVIFVLSVAIMGMALGVKFTFELPGVGGGYTVGIWSILLMASYLLMLFVTYRSQGYPRWQPTWEHPPDESSSRGRSRAGDPSEWSSSSRSLLHLGVYFAGASLVVLAAGWTLAETGDALARQTGLGASYVGFTLLALATSLPEISTVAAATRHHNYAAAFGNIFGSNGFNVVLLVLVGALAGGTATLKAMSASAQFAAALGIFLTCVYLWGLLEHRDRAILRLGWDSVTVLVFALAGNAVIYWLR